MCCNGCFARNHPEAQNVAQFALRPLVGADLAIDAARKGQRDEAIDVLRALFLTAHEQRACRVFVGCPGEALSRASHRTRIRRRPRREPPNRRRVDRPDAPLGIPALDLWWLKSPRAASQGGRQLSTATPSWRNQYLRSAKGSTPAADSPRRGEWCGEQVHVMATMLAHYVARAWVTCCQSAHCCPGAIQPWATRSMCRTLSTGVDDRPTARLRHGRDRSADRGDPSTTTGRQPILVAALKLVGRGVRPARRVRGRPICADAV